MTVEQAIRQTLLADATLTAIIGQRIYWDRAAENVEVPFVVFMRLFGNRLRTHDNGAGAVYAGLTESTFQFSAWAATPTVARQIADRLTFVLERLAPVEEMRLSPAAVNAGVDLDEPEPTNLRGVAIDAAIFHD